MAAFGESRGRSNTDASALARGNRAMKRSARQSKRVIQWLSPTSATSSSVDGSAGDDDLEATERSRGHCTSPLNVAAKA